MIGLMDSSKERARGTTSLGVYALILLLEILVKSTILKHKMMESMVGVYALILPT
jgi:hypothetical protein